VLSLIDNTLLQGLAYGLAVLGVMLSFRVLRYPDLTPDGSFLIGAATYASAAGLGKSWAVGLCLAFLSGSLAGVLTSLLHSLLKINRLLTGILTTMIAYSIGFRVLGGRPNVSLGGNVGVFEFASELDVAEWARSLHVHPGQLLVSLAVALLVAMMLGYLLRSEVGLLLRATGNNRALLAELGRNPAWYQALGLALANGIVALAAAVVSSRQGFADVNMGVGVVITLIAALVIGEECIRVLGIDPRRSLRGRMLGAFLGASAYYMLYLLILRASIRGWIPLKITPTDLKMLSAIVVAAVIALRSRSVVREEALPL